MRVAARQRRGGGCGPVSVAGAGACLESGCHRRDRILALVLVGMAIGDRRPGTRRPVPRVRDMQPRLQIEDHDVSCLAGWRAGNRVAKGSGRRVRPAFPHRGQMVTPMPVASRKRSCQVLGATGAEGGLSTEPRIFCLATSSLVVAFEEERRP